MKKNEKFLKTFLMLNAVITGNLGAAYEYEQTGRSERNEYRKRLS